MNAHEVHFVTGLRRGSTPGSVYTGTRDAFWKKWPKGGHSVGVSLEELSGGGILNCASAC